MSLVQKINTKNTPITPSSLFVPQFGYGTPSDSTSRTRSTANSTSSSMFPYISKTRGRSSTTGSVSYSNSSYATSTRFNLIFSTEPHTDEKKTDKTNDTGPMITAYFSPNISAQPLLSQTSDLNIGAAQLFISP
eukprot:862913_1